MKLLDTAIGLLAGYYVYTEQGRNDAKEGMKIIANMAKQTADELMQEIMITPTPKQEDIIETTCVDAEKETKVKTSEEDARFQTD